MTITAPTRKPSLPSDARARSLKAACLCAKAAEDTRGKETLVLDLTEVTPIVDYFVITTGASGRQMNAVAEEVDRVMRSTGSRPRGVEGEKDSTWILHDFGDIVLHVFSPEARKLYDLEHLWADAPRVDWKAALDGGALGPGRMGFQARPSFSGRAWKPIPHPGALVVKQFSMNILADLRSRFLTALAGLADDPAPLAMMVKPAQDAKFGDYQANCAMPLAKQRGENPRDLAAEIIKRLDVADFCETPEIAGPGFINLKLKTQWLAGYVNRLVPDDRLGVGRPDHPWQIVIDYSSPNVAKPMHVGHLRSTVIGDALYRILGFLGHRVIGDNHVGDWGTQFGMIIYGYKNFLDNAAFQQNAVGELARLYRLVNQLADYHEAVVELPRQKATLAERQAAEAAPVQTNTGPADKKEQEALKKARKRLASEIEELSQSVSAAVKKIEAVETSPALKTLAVAHPNIARAARDETAKLHAGDAENLGLWRQFMPACLAAIDAMYARLGVHFDMTLGESHYQPFLNDVVESLLARKIAVVSDGAVCVFIPGVDAPFIVRKSDGAFTYATTDLATIRYRAEQHGAGVMLYVVDARQGDHFKLLFETAHRWGYEKVDFRHISFGTILDENKQPYKTRSGDTVGLESLLAEAVVEARKVVDAGDDTKPDGPELDAAARARIAEVVGIGAIKYADLCQNRESDYVFSWAKMLATKGDTATYMQYAYARVCGIFRKGNIDREALRRAGGEILVTTPAERALALQLARFHEALDDAASECRPNFLTQYLFQTANTFSTFFEECPVLKAESEALRSSRLLLAELTARVVSQGLSLLGIETIEQM